MAKNILHMLAGGDAPYATVKRRIGKINVGLYCNACDEFFALVVHNRAAGLIEVRSDGAPLFECPFCGARERRQVSEIAELMLTEGRRKRPPMKAGLN